MSLFRWRGLRLSGFSGGVSCVFMFGGEGLLWIASLAGESASFGVDRGKVTTGLNINHARDYE